MLCTLQLTFLFLAIVDLCSKGRKISYDSVFLLGAEPAMAWQR